MTGVEFTLPYTLPSLNVLLREHWAKRKRRLRDLTLHVAALSFGAKARGRFARVYVCRVGTRRLDKDNLYGSCKILMDALSSAGVIDDDAPNCAELDVEQEIGKPARTEVGVTYDERLAPDAGGKGARVAAGRGPARAAPALQRARAPRPRPRRQRARFPV